MLRFALIVAIFMVAAAGFVGVAMGQQTPAVSAGQNAEAKALFEAGSAAYAEGRYEDAFNYFNRSYQISKRPKLLYNIGQTADRMRRDQEALEAFENYLEQVPDAPNRVEVENRVRMLRSVGESNRAKAVEEAGPKPITPEAVAAASPVEPTKAAPVSQKPEGSANQSEPAKPLTSSGEPEHRDQGGGLLSKWWFWTAAAVVVVAAATTGIAIAASGGGQKVQEPLPGSGGVVMTALREAP